MSLPDEAQHGRLSRQRKVGADAEDFASPKQRLEEFGIDDEGEFKLLDRQEDVQKISARRNGDEDLAAYSKRAEVVMRLLGGVRERQGYSADVLESYCQGFPPSVCCRPKVADQATVRGHARPPGDVRVSRNV